MEHAGCKRRVDTCLREYITEMFRRAGATGRDEGNATQLTRCAKLFDVVATTHAIAPHAVEHDLAGATLLHFANPLKRVAPGVARTIRIAGELIDAISLRGHVTVHADDDA